MSGLRRGTLLIGGHAVVLLQAQLAAGGEAEATAPIATVGSLP
jgi:hypothetical protein